MGMHAWMCTYSKSIKALVVVLREFCGILGAPSSSYFLIHFPLKQLSIPIHFSQSSSRNRLVWDVYGKGSLPNPSILLVLGFPASLLCQEAMVNSI